MVIVLGFGFRLLGRWWLVWYVSFAFCVWIFCLLYCGYLIGLLRSGLGFCICVCLCGLCLLVFDFVFWVLLRFCGFAFDFCCLASAWFVVWLAATFAGYLL